MNDDLQHNSPLAPASPGVRAAKSNESAENTEIVNGVEKTIDTLTEAVRTYATPEFRKLSRLPVRFMKAVEALYSRVVKAAHGYCLDRVVASIRDYPRIQAGDKRVMEGLDRICKDAYRAGVTSQDECILKLRAERDSLKGENVSLQWNKVYLQEQLQKSVEKGLSVQSLRETCDELRGELADANWVIQGAHEFIGIALSSKGTPEHAKLWLNPLTTVLSARESGLVKARDEHMKREGQRKILQLLEGRCKENLQRSNGRLTVTLEEIQDMIKTLGEKAKPEPDDALPSWASTDQAGPNDEGDQ